MRSSSFFLTLAAATIAAARPQGIDIDGVQSASGPVIVTPAFDTSIESPTVVPVSLQAEAASAAISTDPASINPYSTVAPSASVLPDAAPSSDPIEKRDGTCATQPPGSGPVAIPDTPAAFAANQVLWVRQPCQTSNN